MKPLILSIAALGLIGCTGQSNLGESTAAEAAAETQHQDVLWFNGTGAVDAGNAVSNLLRKHDGVKNEFNTDSLPAGSAVSTWWIVFNNPSACTHGFPAYGLQCGPADLGIAAVQGSIAYMDGNIVADDGSVHLSGDLAARDPSVCAPHLPCHGGLQSSDSDIHIILRNHGPAASDDAALQAQFHSFSGAIAQAAPFQNNN